MTLFPRPVPDGASEPLVVSFATDKQKVTRVRDIRNRSKRRVLDQTLEPELVTYLYGEDREKRRRVRYEELPDHLVKAVLAIEDRRFFSHPGLDPIGLVRAAIRNLRSDSAIAGRQHDHPAAVQELLPAATPTSAATGCAERSYKRKAQEALLAFVLERSASKQEILEMYLNEVYLGQSGSFGINGVGEAARIYFGKDVTNLTLPESALLAGHDPVAEPLQPVPPRGARDRAAQRGDARDAGRRLHRQAHDGAGAQGAAARGAAERRHAPTRPTSSTSCGQQLGRALRGRRTSQLAQPVDLHDARYRTCRGSPSRRSQRGLDRVQEMIKKRTTRRRSRAA